MRLHWDLFVFSEILNQFFNFRISDFRTSKDSCTSYPKSFDKLFISHHTKLISIFSTYPRNYIHIPAKWPGRYKCPTLENLPSPSTPVRVDLVVECNKIDTYRPALLRACLKDCSSLQKHILVGTSAMLLQMHLFRSTFMKCKNASGELIKSTNSQNRY